MSFSIKTKYLNEQRARATYNYHKDGKIKIWIVEELNPRPLRY